MMPVIRFDDLKDEHYPNGAWFATVDDPENPYCYDKYYGNTPDEALKNWIENNA